MRLPQRLGWRDRSHAYLAANPYCQGCGALAHDADHIIPRAHGGTDAWDNLQALCRSCHSRKTTRIEGHGWRSYRRPSLIARPPNTVVGKW